MNIRQAAAAVGPVSALNFTYYDNYFKNRTWQDDNSEECVCFISVSANTIPKPRVQLRP